jgi:hypothetical protein
MTIKEGIQRLNLDKMKTEGDPEIVFSFLRAFPFKKGWI